LLNVNIPNLPVDAVQFAKVCRLGRRHAAESVIQQDSPRGETMYWIGNAGPVKDVGEGTDFAATASGHISVTPLKADLSDYGGMNAWAQRVASLTRVPNTSDLAVQAHCPP